MRGGLTQSSIDRRLEQPPAQRRNKHRRPQKAFIWCKGSRRVCESEIHRYLTHFLFTQSHTAETVITGIRTMRRPGALRPLLPPRLPHDNSRPMLMLAAPSRPPPPQYSDI